jgi:hypothetical protein
VKIPDWVPDCAIDGYRPHYWLKLCRRLVSLSTMNYGRALMFKNAIKQCQNAAQSGLILCHGLTGRTTRESFASVIYQKTDFYYLTKRANQVPLTFPLNDEWKERVLVMATNHLLQILAAISRPADGAGAVVTI